MDPSSNRDGSKRIDMLQELRNNFKLKHLDERSMSLAQTADEDEYLHDFRIGFLNLRNLSDKNKNLNSIMQDLSIDWVARKDLDLDCVWIDVSNRRLVLEAYEPEILIDLIQSLDLISNSLLHYQLGQLPNKLVEMVENEHQLEETERRTKSELYESADYTKHLMQQLAIAIELDEL